MLHNTFPPLNTKKHNQKNNNKKGQSQQFCGAFNEESQFSMSVSLCYKSLGLILQYMRYTTTYLHRKASVTKSCLYHMRPIL